MSDVQSLIGCCVIDLNFHRYESYLSHSDPVVLTLNPFFVLE